MAGELNSAPAQGDKAADGSKSACVVGAQAHGAAAETTVSSEQVDQSEAQPEAQSRAKAEHKAEHMVVQPGVGGV